MTILLLKFEIHLEKYDIPSILQHHGPLFHRWLPEGKKDAIILDTGDPNADIKVWFEQWGLVDNGWIKFSYDRREVDPKIIPTQAILDAGPLMGILEIKGVSEEELTNLRKNKVGDTRYIALGKRVVKRLLYPPVDRFVNVLRTNYGQYWIREISKWDSSEESLGNYCRSLKLQWSLDNGKTWAPFVPNKSVIMLKSTIHRSYSEYLTKEDWQELVKVAQEGYEPSPAAFVLSLSHQLSNQGNLKHAFIEGVSALEIALNEFIYQKLHGTEPLLKSMSAFWSLPLPAKVTTVATILGKISLQNIEYTINAIDIRNKIVHEGWEPPNDDKTKIKLFGLLNTTASLLSGPRFRFPSANSGNAMMSIEKWKQQMQEDRHDD